MSSEISLDKDDGATLNEIPIDNGNRIITNSKKILGILYGLGYNLNYMIGEDAFNPNDIWKLVHSPVITLVLYVICGIISLLGSSIYIKLGIRSLPSGIGEQKYITDAFNPKRNVGHIFSFVAILVSDIINHTLVLFKIIALLIISIVGIVKLGMNHNNWNSIFNAPFDFGANYGKGLLKALLTYEGFLTNAAFITVVEYNINDNESTPIHVRFGKELCGKTGETLMSILVAISSFGCSSYIPENISDFFADTSQYSAMIYHGTEEFIGETDQSEEAISETGRD
ncbi:18763_t:CDS:2 [Gigaspora margarita]|uniref:18763_t:CDS:1 n=1 Tax=Gigaspora margarita TaxID=4874 RepID=A0ABM8W121_GIGMA|nr:18763_t:CDS:2 [Gigaspora margarita]